MSKDDYYSDNSQEIKQEVVNLDSRQNIMEAVKKILIHIGEDPNRDALLDTPLRVAKSYEELFRGYSLDIYDLVNGALFEVDYGNQEMIIVDNIEFASMCEHHMLPFTGKAHVAYIPSEKVIGLSKIPRIVDMYARRLQVQERLSNQIADAIEEILKPQGVIVFMEGTHMCASLRGVKKHKMNMRTSATRGKLAEDKELRKEFYDLISG